jgi:CrcB protein
MLKQAVGLALAGAAGTLCRVGLSAVVAQWLPRSPFWGTTAVNVLGSFFYGLVWALGVQHRWISPELRPILLAGFMGAFTTFSTYLFDTVQLSEISGLRAALTHFALQNLMALACLLAGLALGRSG